MHIRFAERVCLRINFEETVLGVRRNSDCEFVQTFVAYFCVFARPLPGTEELVMHSAGGHEKKR